MPLRPYQNDLVNRVRECYRHGCRAPCIVLPCGGGKSVIAAEIALRTTQRGKNVLFLIHRKELKDQIIRTFDRYGVDMSLCDVEMVQTAALKPEKLQTPALIITDENHHAAAASYKKIYRNFPGARLLGITATPTRLNGDGLGDVNDVLVEGVTARWLIENHYLAPYRYFAPSVADLSGVRINRGEYNAEDISAALSSRTVFGDVIAHYKRLADGRQTICYCATVSHSERMAAAFRSAGIEAAHIDGGTPAAERADIIEKYRRGAIDILCNVDLISEGFDVPDCSCTIMLRPTKSLTLFIQQAMRCMRYRPGKTAVIIDHVGNYVRHGMPDSEHNWTLKKKAKKKEAEEPVSLRECPKCFGVFSPRLGNVCPFCGYEFPPPDSRKELEEADAELTEVTGFTTNYTRPEDCGSYAELLEYAERAGYKRGWAYYQAKARGFI